MKIRHRLNFGLALLMIALMVTVVGCGKTATPTSPPPQTTETPKPARPDLILATTTSTQDSGLLEVLIPAFEKKTGYKVKTVAVGTGAALAMGEKGDADVLLVHAFASEKNWLITKQPLIINLLCTMIS